VRGGSAFFVRPIMRFDIYTFTAAAFCVLHLALAAAAITFCIRIFQRTQDGACLFLGVVFVEPFVRVIGRLARGLPMLWYQSSGIGSDGAPRQILHFDFPALYLLSAIGLYLLYRKYGQDRPSA